MTPNFAVIRIQNLIGSSTERSASSLWGFPIVVPLFLFWIPTILLTPLVLLVLWPVCIAAEISFTQTVATFWNLLCGLPGTDVRVCAEGKRITVRIL
jgi:uncharacterized membrane protein